MSDTMPEQRHTRESIVQTLKNVAANLNKQALSNQDIQAHLPLSSVAYHFGSVGEALKTAGLTVPVRDVAAHIERLKLTDDELFGSLWEVGQKLGHDPTFPEYRANGGSLSNRPFRARFGKWDVTLQHYRKWKADRGEHPEVSNKLQSGSDLGNGQSLPESPAARSEQPPGEAVTRQRKTPQMFGEPIDFRGLRHAPINEQGVVYLFGMVSRELGFSVEALQQGFPDCEGKYLHDKGQKLWAKARIEFEFRASNFRTHGHNAAECDVIVCWNNDWPDCPLRVVELKSEIMRLPSR